MKINREDRFWKHVIKSNSCWVWKNGKTTAGYGMFMLSKKEGGVYAHRFSYELFNGPIKKGHYICHRCDVPSCVNPKHLFSGTQKDNMRDALKKGRYSFGKIHASKCIPPKGEKNGQAKLTENIVREIRKYHSNMITYREIAKKFSICQTTAFNIVKRKSWKHI